MLQDFKYFIGVDLSISATGISLIDKDKNLLQYHLIVTDEKQYKKLKDKQNEKFKIHFLSPEDGSRKIRPIDTLLKCDIIAQKIIYIIGELVNNYAGFIALETLIIIESNVQILFKWCQIYPIVEYLLRKGFFDYITVNPKTVKKYIFGSGSADKTQMGNALRNKYSIDFSELGDVSNNIVDSTSLAIIGNDFCSVKDFSKLNEEIAEEKIFKTIAIQNNIIEKPKKERKTKKISAEK